MPRSRPPTRWSRNDYGKLREIIDLITPGLVFAASGSGVSGRDRGRRGARGPRSRSRPIRRPGERPRPSPICLRPRPRSAVETAAARVGPDTIAKFLFTSGSTGMPKAVINTQRMLCSNQAMIATMLAFLQDEPPVMVDWLPWHHTAGGNHNIGLVLYNGGSLYIDDGRPTAAEIGATVRNLREIATTFYVNVPKGFEVLLPYLEDDRGVAPALLQPAAADVLRRRPPRAARLGGIAAPCAGDDRRAHPHADRAGRDRDGAVRVHARQGGEPGGRGRPARARHRAEARAVGWNGASTSGSKAPTSRPATGASRRLTAEAFDEEGFYRLGDALRFIDPAAPAKGFVFEGRIAEDFKLSTGTWVHVGELRRIIIAHFAPLLRDAVIAGHDRDEVTVLLVPDLEACRRLCGDATAADRAFASLGIAAPPPPGPSG